MMYSTGDFVYIMSIYHEVWNNTDFWGILQHGGVYILEHSVGRYSKGDAQPRSYCGKSTVDLDDSNTPTSGKSSLPDFYR